MSTTRCVGCGKPFEAGTKTMRVSSGKEETKGFDESKEWGRFHVACFESSINSPDIALARMRRMVKQAKVKNA